MKIFKLLTLIFFLISSFSCDKDESEELNNLDFESYVKQLIDGNYKLLDLPEFTHNDIPALLEYRNETQLITNFPMNWASSMGMLDCSLGMYTLWTIESIRAVAIDSEYLIGRFPSQNPIVQKREDGSNIERGSDIQKIISKAYYDWWGENKKKEFDSFMNIDPLLKTEYRWH